MRLREEMRSVAALQERAAKLEKAETNLKVPGDGSNVLRELERVLLASCVSTHFQALSTDLERFHIRNRSEA